MADDDEEEGAEEDGWFVWLVDWLICSLFLSQYLLRDIEMTYHFSLRAIDLQFLFVFLQ